MLPSLAMRLTAVTSARKALADTGRVMLCLARSRRANMVGLLDSALFTPLSLVFHYYLMKREGVYMHLFYFILPGLKRSKCAHCV